MLAGFNNNLDGIDAGTANLEEVVGSAHLLDLQDIREDAAEELFHFTSESQMILLGKEMDARHGDAYNVTDDGSPSTTLDAPAEVLDEHHVEHQVNDIIHQDGYRHQAWTAINADHRVKTPHQQVGRCTYLHHSQVFEGRLIELLVVTQQACHDIGCQHTTCCQHETCQQRGQHRNDKDVLCPLCVLFA